MDSALFKVVLLGDVAAGKTALLSQFAYKHFKENYKATIGSDFTTRDIAVDGTVVTLQIWDTAGQERFRSLSTAFFRGTNVCMYVLALVYDVTDPRTLDSLAEWKSEFIEQVGNEEEEDFAFIVVGNKVDLEAARQVTRSKGEQVAREIGALAHFETSAKTAHNVEKAFHSAASNALQRNAQRKLYVVPSSTANNVRPNISGDTLLHPKKEEPSGPCC